MAKSPGKFFLPPPAILPRSANGSLPATPTPRPAAGAAASSLLTGLFSDTNPDETNAEREAKRNLILTLVTGLAAATGQNPADALNGGTAAVDNNWLATQQIVQAKKELAACTTTACQAQVIAKWGKVSAVQDALTLSGMGKGLVNAGWSDVKGIYQFVTHFEESINGIKQIINDADARGQLTQELKADLNAKIDRIKTAMAVGGDANALQAGEDLGNLLWQVGSVVTVVDGVAKGAATLAKVGVNVTADTMILMAKNMPPLVTGTLADAAGTFRFTSQQLPELANIARNSKGIGDLGEQVSAQLLEEASGKKFVPIQNASGNGVDLVYVDEGTKTIYHVEVKTNQAFGNGGVPEGDLGAMFTNWVNQAAQGKIVGKPISQEAQNLAISIQDNIRDNGYKVSNNLMQVEIPRTGRTGEISASLRPWPPQ